LTAPRQSSFLAGRQTSPRCPPKTSDKKHEAHDLIPAALAASLPRLYATERESDPLARVKLFTPDSSWTWYVAEYDPEERIAFGLVRGLDEELGYFSIDELEKVRVDNS
jgi:hypothetical protein